ncbi:hypothetical protein [Roseococcus microcysteis]|uniref:hypothetical protein n=1 Tax=Roseococcus microcysteis TaxID=2771361 RepID=UPI00168A4756|nr:hypothetical protein [Roseococcus microcysteis]
MRAALRLWRGEAPLDVAFWNWAVISALVVNITTTIGFFLLFKEGQILAAYLVGYGMSLPYNLLALVGVWRSAARYAGPPFHAALARWAATLLLAVLSAT